MKVMTIVGTRPELIKMSRVIHEFDKFTNHTLVHTGQNYDYELNQVFFEDLNIRKPDYFLECIGTNPMQQVAKIIEKSYGLMKELQPDAILLYGDTNSCLAVLSAKRLKIPVFHMEAGNRCFDERVPEELNRKVLDHLSDINLVLTEHARRYLLAEGLNPVKVIKTGSHMPEVLNYYSKSINNSKILHTLELSKDGYFLISAHREENVDSKDKLINLVDSLMAIDEKYKMPIIVSTHPRTRKNLNSIVSITKKIKGNRNIKFLKPFGFFDYINLQKNSYVTLSDSGTITEESAILGFPAITIRDIHERPEGMDAGTLIMSRLNVRDIMQALEITIEQKKQILIKEKITDYSSINVSSKILKIVFSYTNYINDNVWRK